MYACTHNLHPPLELICCKAGKCSKFTEIYTLILYLLHPITRVIYCTFEHRILACMLTFVPSFRSNASLWREAPYSRLVLCILLLVCQYLFLDCFTSFITLGRGVYVGANKPYFIDGPRQARYHNYVSWFISDSTTHSNCYCSPRHETICRISSSNLTAWKNRVVQIVLRIPIHYNIKYRTIYKFSLSNKLESKQLQRICAWPNID